MLEDRRHARRDVAGDAAAVLRPRSPIWMLARAPLGRGEGCLRAVAGRRVRRRTGAGLWAPDFLRRGSRLHARRAASGHRSDEHGARAGSARAVPGPPAGGLTSCRCRTRSSPTGARRSPCSCEACARPLPADLVRRPKRGFTLPFDVWMRGALRSYCEAQLGEQGLDGRGVFKPGEAMRLWSRFTRRARGVTWARVWTLVTLNAWIERQGCGRSMNILGINAYHGDVSAVLVRDGELVAAVEEERFRRIKHVAGFPTEAIRACLRMAGITRRDVDHVGGVAQSARAPVAQGLFALRHRPGGGLLRDRAANYRRVGTIPETVAEALGLSAADPRPQGALGRASSGAPGERVLRVAVRRRGRVRDRRLRRFRQHVVGRGPRHHRST